MASLPFFAAIVVLGDANEKVVAIQQYVLNSNFAKHIFQLINITSHMMKKDSTNPLSPKTLPPFKAKANSPKQTQLSPRTIMATSNENTCPKLDANNAINPPKLMESKNPTITEPTLFPLPLASFWRIISDHYVRENVEAADTYEQEQGARRSPTVPPPPGATRTLDEHEHSPTRTLDLLEGDAPSPNCDMTSSKSLPLPPFACLPSETRETDDNPSDARGDDCHALPYLDPELVRRSQALSVEDFDDGIPRIVSFPSNDDNSLDSPTSKTETKKKYRRVHGTRRAWDAYVEGCSTVAACCRCQTRYVVDASAKALYCTTCDSVTNLHDTKRDKSGPKEALWHTDTL